MQVSPLVLMQEMAGCSLIRYYAEITFPNLIFSTEEHLGFRGELEENNLDFLALGLLPLQRCLILL